MSIYHICTNCEFNKDLSMKPCSAQYNPYNPTCIKNDQFMVLQKQRMHNGYIDGRYL